MTDKMRAVREEAILVVDDDRDFLNEVRLMLVSNGAGKVVTLNDSRRVLDELEQGGIAVLLLDWVMPHKTGADLLPVVVRTFPQVPVVVMTAVSDLETVVGCIKQGAFDYITKPLDSNRVLSAVHRALQISELAIQNQQLMGYLLGEPLAHPEHFGTILTVSERMQALFKIAETIAATRQPVLITGETGVGKELFAQAIHKSSGLTGDFVPLNVAGLDEFMFTDTLFGHKKGAYTGAHESREGLLAKAQGGTLFLDEIGDLSLESQVKLLRLLQEHEYYRLGSDALLKSDARIIAASNRDFASLISQGSFRQDLYHRLCFHEIRIPPLRERREDVVPLVEYYVREAAGNCGKNPPELSRELCLALMKYDFPGNVRELISKVNGAVTLNSSGALTLRDFPGLPLSEERSTRKVRVAFDGHYRLQATFEEFPSVDDMERLLIDEALKATGGNKSAAAELLGISRPTLNRKLVTE